MTYIFSDFPVDLETPMSHYELLDTIGKGAFATVVAGRHVLTGREVAVKIIRQRDYLSVHRHLQQEVRCMEALHHPNIVQLFHVIGTATSLCLVMELVPGRNLLDYLCFHGRMRDGVARGVFRQLVSALHYCHEQGIAHRDLKPQNVLLDKEMKVKITDFGCGTSFTGRQLSTFCGSPVAAPPELYLGLKYDGPAMDMWGLGVLLYKMLTNTVPFRGGTMEGLRDNVLTGLYVVPSFISPEAENLLKKLLTFNPENRQSLKDIMPDTWLNRGWEELKPYVEPPGDATDPWVTREMMRLGFRWEDIHNTLSNKTNNHLMATYRILKVKKAELCGHTIKVTSFHPPKAQSHGPCPAQEVHPQVPGGLACSSCQQSEQNAPELPRPSAIQEPNTTTPESTAEPQATIPQPTPASRTTSPKAGRSSRAATHKPRWGSGAAMPEPIPDSSTATPMHRPEATSNIHSLATPCHPGNSASGHGTGNSQGSREDGRQGLRRVARRCLTCLRKLCCLPPQEGPSRSNKVTPL